MEDDKRLDKDLVKTIKKTGVKPQPHHSKDAVSHNRPAYRRGKKLTAVKTYTIVDESTHLLVFGVPAIKLRDELSSIARKCGEVTVVKVEDYPNLESFTELFHLVYDTVDIARVAKRKLDGLEFYGGILHACYAPELETVAETREKLNQRVAFINGTKPQRDSLPNESYNFCKKKEPL